MTSMYLVSTKNLQTFLDSLRSAKAPDKFTLKFLEDLGFKSTNDRLFLGMLKALKFVDESGTPTKRYFQFLDDSQWKSVLAEGIRDAYEDLFTLNKKAHALSSAEINGKLKSMTEGKKSDAVLSNMVRTFVELSKIADFSTATPSSTTGKLPDKQAEPPAATLDKGHSPPAGAPKAAVRHIDGLSYRIEIVLPAVRDPAVYDAIFKSLKEHLL